MEPVLSYKIVTLGEGRVGKTSLALRFVDNKFHENEKQTINANFMQKNVRVGSQTVQLSIWDTAGQERFRAIASNYYRDAKGALIVYDITDKTTFDRVIAWVNELQVQASKDIAIVLVGNKCDKENERSILKQTATDFAKRIGAAHFSTSAKNGVGVEECFLHLAKTVFENDKSRGSIRKSGVRKRITVVESTVQQKKKSKCC